MNRKGFSLVELLGCLALLGFVLCIGLYTTRGTLSTALSSLTTVSKNQLYEAAELYAIESKVTWINNTEEYVCVPVMDLVDAGYFKNEEVVAYKDSAVKIIRDKVTKVINSKKIVYDCK